MAFQKNLTDSKTWKGQWDYLGKGRLPLLGGNLRHITGCAIAGKNQFLCFYTWSNLI